MQVAEKEINTTDCFLDNTTLVIAGKVTLHKTTYVVNKAQQIAENYQKENLVIDMDQVEQIDSGGVVGMHYISRMFSEAGVEVQFSCSSESINKKMELFKPFKNNLTEKPAESNFFARVGKKVHIFYFDYFIEFIFLASNVLHWTLNDLFTHRGRRKGETINQAVKIGVNAALIVAVMAFIIGFVLALQTASQLKHYGADVFIVDLIVLAMMSEMGPLITAILVAGRSGSSIAAEIATMKVTSELDALKTMGLNPLRFVVVPKMYGCLLTLPFLTILANIAGILGGMLTAYTSLGITPEVFINRMGESLYNKDILTGISKSIVFGVLIVLTGSFYGFNVDKGAEGVGKVTTNAVVVAIALVIIADSIMGLIFY